jgi:hypothetical protein
VLRLGSLRDRGRQDSRIVFGDAYIMGHRFWSSWVGLRNSELQAHAMALIELERAFMGLDWVKGAAKIRR